MKLPIDQRIVDHVNKLVSDGVFNVNEMKRHVNIFVRSLFSHTALPSPTNRKFYPSWKDLRKMMYRQRCKLKKGMLDQDCLSAKLAQWQNEKPLDEHHF